MRCLYVWHLGLLCPLFTLNACYYDDDCLYAPQATYCNQKKKWEIEKLNSLHKKNSSLEEQKIDMKDCHTLLKNYNNNLCGTYDICFTKCMKEKGYQEIKK